MLDGVALVSFYHFSYLIFFVYISSAKKKKKKKLLSRSFLSYTSAQEEASVASTLHEYLLTALSRLLPLHFFLQPSL